MMLGLNRLSLLKGVDLSPERKAALITELLSLAFTRKRFIDACASIESSNTYHNISIDDFIRREDVLPVLIYKEATKILKTKIELYRKGLSDTEKNALRIDEFLKCKSEYDALIEGVIGDARREFLAAIHVDNEKIKSAARRISNASTDVVKELAKRWGVK